MEISPTAALLTAAGQQRTFSAVAYDADGNRLKTPIAWASSSPAVAITASGVASSTTALGSAQVTATAGGVQSSPTLVVMAEPADGAVLVNDDQVVGDPAPEEASADQGPGYRINVTLQGIDAPPAGTLLVGTGEKAVGGRVVSAQASGRQVAVTLEVVPLESLFKRLSLDESLDLSRASVALLPDLVDAYEIKRLANRDVQATPRQNSGASSVKRLQVSGTTGVPLGPFGCKLESNPDTPLPPAIPLSLPTGPSVTFTLPMSLDVRYTPDHHLERFVLRGQPRLGLQLNVVTAASFEEKYSCKGDFLTLRVPAPGPLGLLLGGYVVLGAGFDIGGKITLSQFGFKVDGNGGADFELGVDCAGGGECQTVKDSRRAGSPLKVTPVLPDAGTQFRIEPSTAAYLTVSLELGSFLRALRLETFKAQAGFKLAGSFASPNVQAADAAYASSYALSFEASAGVGKKIDTWLNLLNVTLLKAEGKLSVPLSRSPNVPQLNPAALTPTPDPAAITVDKADYRAGDRLSFHVELDPNTVDFLLNYNVSEVQVWRKAGGGAFEKVASAPATAGQKDFDLSWTANVSGTSAGHFMAFVVSRLVPLEITALELGLATVQDQCATLYGLRTLADQCLTPTGTLTTNHPTLYVAPCVHPTAYVQAGGFLDPAVTWQTNLAINKTGLEGNTSWIDFQVPLGVENAVVTATSVEDPRVSVTINVIVRNVLGVFNAGIGIGYDASADQYSVSGSVEGVSLRGSYGLAGDDTLVGTNLAGDSIILAATAESLSVTVTGPSAPGSIHQTLPRLCGGLT